MLDLVLCTISNFNSDESRTRIRWSRARSSPFAHTEWAGWFAAPTPRVSGEEGAMSAVSGAGGQ